MLTALIVPLLVCTQGSQKPFPLKTTTLKRDGAVYTVEGRVRIPRSQTIVSLRHMKLKGIGPDAVLEVAGKLEMKAVTGGAVTIENVTIELLPDCKELALTSATFTGTSGLRSSEEGPNSAKVYLSSTKFRGKAACDLKMSGGRVDLHQSHSDSPVRIMGVHPSEKNRAKLTVRLLSNNGTENGRPTGLMGGLFLTGAWDASITSCDMAGAHSVIANNRGLLFAANNMRSKLAEFRQDAPKAFARTKIQNSDFRGPDTLFFAPVNPAKPDKLTRIILDGCYFQRRTDSDIIRDLLIRDSGREPKSGMLVTFKKISERPRNLGGKAE